MILIYHIFSTPAFSTATALLRSDTSNNTAYKEVKGLFDRGRLKATGGVIQIEGAGGAGVSTWALISGYGTKEGIGINAHHSFAALDDFNFNAIGVTAGLFNRVEISYTRQFLDTLDAGERLGIGRGFVIEQDIIGAKVRILGDAVYDQDRLLPQISAGIQYKRSPLQSLVKALGAKNNNSFDYYVTATKVFLDKSLLLSSALRLTEANQFGLLGFGSEAAGGSQYSLQIESSLVALLHRDFIIGIDYRTRPNNLDFAPEQNALAVYGVWLPNKFVTLTAGYVNLGSIALQGRQAGLYLSLQVGF